MKSSFAALSLALILLSGPHVSPAAAIRFRLRFPGLHISDSGASQSTSDQQASASSHLNLRRRVGGLFDSDGSSGGGNGNGGNLDLVVVLKDDADSRVRKLSQGKGPKIAAANKAKAAAVAKGLGVNPERTYGAALYGFSVRGATQAQMDAIKANDQVAYVEMDQTIQLDPMEMEPEDAGRQLRQVIKGTEKKSTLKDRQLAPPPGKGPSGGGGGGGQTIPWGITRVRGGIDVTTITAGVGTAWVLDTGIDLTHPDLNVDATRGWSAWSSGPDASPNDLHGHGTHVSGTIAALDNGIGVIGVAAGATVVPIKVLGRNGSGSWAGIIDGIDFVAANANPGDVANMSLGGGFYQPVNDAVETAARDFGVKFALAAGNESTDAGTRSPASAEDTNIYTVSSMTSSDKWSSFSNYGNPPIDYCAPGSSVYSTYKGGGYATMSGTSMAAPHVAGILLLGNCNNGGTVIGDPDGNSDTIACV